MFGRDARCRTCHALLNTLNPRLVPALLKIKAKEARRASGGGADSRAVKYGLYEETIEAYVQSACSTQDLWHAKETRKQCERIMEEHEDDVASAYTRWIKKGAPEREDEGWSWNWRCVAKPRTAVPSNSACTRCPSLTTTARARREQVSL